MCMVVMIKKITLRNLAHKFSLVQHNDVHTAHMGTVKHFNFARLNFCDFTVLGHSRALNFREIWIKELPSCKPVFFSDRTLFEETTHSFLKPCFTNLEVLQLAN